MAKTQCQVCGKTKDPPELIKVETEKFSSGPFNTELMAQRVETWRCSNFWCNRTWRVVHPPGKIGGANNTPSTAFNEALKRQGPRY